LDDSDAWIKHFPDPGLVDRYLEPEVRVIKDEVRVEGRDLTDPMGVAPIDNRYLADFGVKNIPPGLRIQESEAKQEVTI
jgi:hypothetical protein